MYSDGEAHQTEFVSGKKAKVTFSFTGTGIDIYSRTNQYTGTILVTIKSETYTNFAVVDNLEERGDYYQIPVVTFTDLSYDTYIVDIMVSMATDKDEQGNVTRERKMFYLDGVRVYNPLGSNDSYYDKSEQGAVFTTLKKIVFDSNTITDYQEEINGSIVLDKALDANSVIGIISNSKNEIYLNSGQAIVFKVGKTEGAHYYIGLKNPSADGTKGKITDGNSTKQISINTASDLYYEVVPNDEGYISIINTSTGVENSNVLSITKLRTTGIGGQNDIVGISAEEALNYIKNN